MSLQTPAVVTGAVVAGSGLTVTEIVNDAPKQPEALMGVIVYTTFTGLPVVLAQASSVNSAGPLPAPADTVPALWVSPLGLVAIVKLAAGALPEVVVIVATGPTGTSLQTIGVAEMPTGAGLTVMVNDFESPVHVGVGPVCGVTVIVPTNGTFPLFTAVKAAILLVPFIANPIDELSLVQL